MMRRLLLSALLLASPAFATTRYVDGNLGADCTSGNYSIASRNCSGANGNAYNTLIEGLNVTTGGDTLYLRAGTYTQQLHEQSFAGTGTSGSPILISRYQNETAILRPSGSNIDILRFQDSTIHHVTIFGLELDCSQTGGTWSNNCVFLGDSAFIDDSHDITLDSLTIHEAKGNCILGGGTNHTIKNNEVYRCGIDDNNGFYLQGIRDSVIEHNHVWNNGAFAIRVWNSGGSPKADNNIIRHNRVHMNGFGIGIDGASETVSGGGGLTIGESDNLIYNNLSYDNYLGLQVPGSGSAVLVYHNTFYHNVADIVIDSGADDTEVKNSILFGSDSTISNSGTGTVTSNNVTSDPSFVDAGNGDFHLQSGSVARNAGTNLLATVATDFDGVSRDTSPDVGAYEFVSASPTRSGHTVGGVRSTGKVRVQ